MSSLVFCLTLRLHLNLISLLLVDSETPFDRFNGNPKSKPLFLIFLFLSLYSHMRIYMFYNIFPGTDKTGTGLNSG